MPEPHDDNSLFAECLAAMTAAGDAYPCEILAPALPDDCALPPLQPAQPDTANPSTRGT